MLWIAIFLACSQEAPPPPESGGDTGSEALEARLEALEAQLAALEIPAAYTDEQAVAAVQNEDPRADPDR
jgi:hypothetical protein